MKRSAINDAYHKAGAYFKKCCWNLPPHPKWDITDFGLKDFDHCGLVLVNLAQEAEYCEKLMYAKRNQQTPLHFHKLKKEDIICRNGKLNILIWHQDYDTLHPKSIKIQINGKMLQYIEGTNMQLSEGERVTIDPLCWHSFYPISEECIIGEVSTANNDSTDNFFYNQDIGRYPEIIEDEMAQIKLISEG